MKQCSLIAVLAVLGTFTTMGCHDTSLRTYTFGDATPEEVIRSIERWVTVETLEEVYAPGAAHNTTVIVDPDTRIAMACYPGPYHYWELQIIPASRISSLPAHSNAIVFWCEAGGLSWASLEHIGLWSKAIASDLGVSREDVYLRVSKKQLAAASPLFLGSNERVHEFMDGDIDLPDSSVVILRGRSRLAANRERGNP